MKLAAINVTYNQPVQLGRMVECFLRQTYQNRRLLILDDAGQIPEGGGNRWVAVSRTKRYPTLGAKRNAAVWLAARLWPDMDAYVVMDTDDIYLPHHMEACASALKTHGWAQPSVVLRDAGSRFTQHRTFRDDDPRDIGYHGGWAFRMGTFLSLGGYSPLLSNGEDKEIADRATEECGPSGEVWHTTPSGAYESTYCYTVKGRHLSAMGEHGYKEYSKAPVTPVDALDVRWDHDYTAWPVEDKVHPRRW